MKIISIVILMAIFAFLNRVRGGGLNWVWKDFSNLSKPLIGAIIGALVYMHTPEWWVFLPCIGLYWGGESFGWGKWMGAILDDRPRYDEDDGKENGIHYLANAIVPEKKDFTLYSKIAIVLRGFLWFGPVLIFSKFFGADHVTVGVITISVGFLVSLLVAQNIKLKIDPIMKIVDDHGLIGLYDKQSYSDKDWMESEVIYGAIQGLALGLCFLV